MAVVRWLRSCPPYLAGLAWSGVRTVAPWVRVWLPYVAAFALAGYTYIQSVRAQDQFCLGVEEQHLTDVNQLKGTYRFLDDLSATGAQKNRDLVVAIVQQLPQTEKRARHDVAPPLCDGRRWPAGTLGRPEPDPKLPERRDFSYLLAPD